jgi:hypothetical protein
MTGKGEERRRKRKPVQNQSRYKKKLIKMGSDLESS